MTKTACRAREHSHTVRQRPLGDFGQRRSTFTSFTAQILPRLDPVSHFIHCRLASRSPHYELLGLTTGKTTRNTRMGAHHPLPPPN